MPKLRQAVTQRFGESNDCVRFRIFPGSAEALVDELKKLTTLMFFSKHFLENHGNWLMCGEVTGSERCVVSDRVAYRKRKKEAILMAACCKNF